MNTFGKTQITNCHSVSSLKQVQTLMNTHNYWVRNPVQRISTPGKMPPETEQNICMTISELNPTTD